MRRETESLLACAALAEKYTVIDPQYVPSYHIAPPCGWMNDPCGLCYFRGEHHIFYQYSPFAPERGLIFWGHTATRDFINYRQYPPALAPDMPFDCHGVYTGSAVAEDDRLRLFYTGNVRDAADRAGDGILSGRRQTVITCCSENGTVFPEKQIVLAPEDYPKGLSCHVRDPKIIPSPDGYDMLLGMRTIDGRGGFLRYHTASMKDGGRWVLSDRFEDEDGSYMWECPDELIFGPQRFFSCCRQSTEPRTDAAGYFSEDTARRPTGGFHLWDAGPDFYAPQTWRDGTGRTLLLAWMGKPGSAEGGLCPECSHGWVHALTLPRVITVENGNLRISPLPELDSICGHRIPVKKHGGMRIASCFSLSIGPGPFCIRCGALSMKSEGGVFTLDPGRYGAGRMPVLIPADGAGYTVFFDRSPVEGLPRACGPT
ncbi:MAG: glycoside hydrolase family 32 protein, partial [Clostridia bacterium]|nr:glycoside hydrolase family 32 protein [Clostridia bacterium]